VSQKRLNESHLRLREARKEDRGGRLNYLTAADRASKLSLLEVKIENLVALRIFQEYSTERSIRLK